MAEVFLNVKTVYVAQSPSLTRYQTCAVYHSIELSSS